MDRFSISRGRATRGDPKAGRLGCATIEGIDLRLILESQNGVVFGQVRSTAAKDSSYEIGRFEVVWRVLDSVADGSPLSFATPFGFVIMRRLGPMVEIAYGNDIANEYGLAVMSVVEYREVMDRLRSHLRAPVQY